MLPQHLRKFSDLYEKYGLGAVKNLWLLTCLLPIARTVNLYKWKDHVGGLLGKQEVEASSHYRQLEDRGDIRTRSGGEGYVIVRMPNPKVDAKEPILLFLTDTAHHSSKDLHQEAYI